MARRLGVPTVNVWISSPAKHVPCVFTDYPDSGRLVAEHLLSRGFVNASAFIHPNDRAVQRQAAVFRETVEASGIGRWCAQLEEGWATNHREWRRTVRIVTAWMDTLEPPVGLLVREPGHARLVVELAQARGWHIPQDVAIVCSYNEDSLCEKPEPSISAVRMPHERCGFEAARLLDRLIDARRRGEDPFADPQTVTLPAGGIVTRFSTDFFAVADTLVQRALRYIAENLSRPLSVESVAEHLDVSRRTLDARFHEALGSTVAAEIKRLRLERVKRELSGTTDTLAVIAKRNGFTSMRTFHDQFSTTVGATPQAFRQVTAKRMT